MFIYKIVRSTCYNYKVTTLVNIGGLDGLEKDQNMAWQGPDDDRVSGNGPPWLDYHCSVFYIFDHPTMILVQGGRAVYLLDDCGTIEESTYAELLNDSNM